MTSPLPRLGPFLLGAPPAGVRVPGYRRAEVTPGIVHLGVGAFHRAHQAVYLDDLLAADPGWGIVGASLRSPETSDALGPQDGLYTVAVRDGEDTRLRIVGSLLRVLALPGDREALFAAMVDPGVRIVTLTVTEKGYCHDPASGDLDERHPAIVADLADPANPGSVPGLIVEALARRRAAGTAPFTVLSCDNLPANGRTTGRIVRRYADLRDPDLGAFVGSDVAFPSSMVDRIVPATTDADREAVASRLGARDAWPVMTEPFSQWVVEDRFPAGRPRLEDAGVQMVDDVEPWEHMKLRMLNGAHSTLAYLGYLAGHETVAAAIADPPFRALLHGLMTEEVMPTLHVTGADLPAYRDALLARFANTGLRHRTWQIAMDGSQKLPQRLLGTVRDRLAAGAPVERLALGVAAWMAYVRGVDERGDPIDVRDPLAGRLRAITDAAGRDPVRLADGLLGVGEIFGRDLPASGAFRAAVVGALGDLLSEGAAAAVRRRVGAG